MPSAHDWPARAVVAKSLLANVRSIEELLQLVEANRGLDKYDPDQPRVPAGSGSESGQWTNNSGVEQASVNAIPAVAALTVRSAPLFAPSLGAETLAALSTFATSVGFAAALGFLFVPSPNSTSSSGLLPGDTENTYSRLRPILRKPTSKTPSFARTLDWISPARVPPSREHGRVRSRSAS